MLINRAAGFVLPWSSKELIDVVIPSGNGSLLWPLAAAVGAATVVQAASSFGVSQILGVAAQRAITEMRRAVQSHLVRLPIRTFDATQTGQLVSRVMSDAEGIRNLVGTGLVQLVGGAVTAAVAFTWLMILNWRLTSVTAVLLVVFGGGMAYAFTRLRPIFRERGKLNAEVTGRLVESISGIRVVKAYTAERREQHAFAKGANKLFRNVAATMTGVSATTALSTVIVGIIGTLLIVVGGRDILAGRMSSGDLFQYVFLTGLLAAPLIQIASIGTQVTEAFAGLDRIRELRAVATEDEGDADLAPLGQVTGHVAFENVTFSYDEGTPVLKGITFDAPAGTTTALVGTSGSGKSTLVSLVMAFNRPDSGRILIDGRDLATFRLREYRRTLGIVLQDNFLFDGTILDNIRFAKPDATAEEVREAARIAHCDEFALRFDLGYETIVGERGVKLSGGQRQRVAIARAILANPAILILDEATSSLDSESEGLIQEGLTRLRAGRTTFVIAHRLSTITSADQILVLEGGEIVERGSHDALVDLGGRYHALYERQFRQALDRYVNPGEELAGASRQRP
ncbi:MAG: ABC transporter ATP-binding protein [Gemmatimonadetes bacterium]|nr:ABC transporter ATP-binding protein [Gemmatimonadota bacterium]MBP6444190.1 ABC transporter ATP-binding protein [Gemmatimonadales bacterium]MBK9548806.1 ABC transporter ATP-binding protein [Gemmatimonadota bacterium]MBP6571484.1 ABC transporter ATP-binding protein [Gemmatimonadales bacterium]MBP7621726.1 ABC transporter ATP-binding protein [Gemmatimonadales bacterium]